MHRAIKQKNSPTNKCWGIYNLARSTFPSRRQLSIIDALDLTSVFEMRTGVTLKL